MLPLKEQKYVTLVSLAISKAVKDPVNSLLIMVCKITAMSDKDLIPKPIIYPLLQFITVSKLAISGEPPTPYLLDPSPTIREGRVIAFLAIELELYEIFIMIEVI